MSTRTEVYSALLACGIKGTEAPGYPVGKAPPLPWFVYAVQPGKAFFADDSCWYGSYRVTVDLYQRELDEALEEAVSAVCARMGNLEEPAHTWLKTESVWVTTYEFEYHPEKGAQDGQG